MTDFLKTKAWIRNVASRGLVLSQKFPSRLRPSFSWRVLMYHRVVDPEELLYPLEPGMYVRPETFALQMRYLSSNYNVLPLDALYQLLVKRQEPPLNTIVITFDDGWKDTYENAFPLLQEAGLTATVFLATGYLESDKLFWTDRLALLLACLRGGANRPKEKTEGAAQRLFPVYGRQILSCPEACLAAKLAEEIAKLKQLPPPEREDLLNEFWDENCQELRNHCGCQFLSWEQVRQMQAKGVDFGSHSHWHIDCAYAKQDALKADLQQSRSAFNAHGVELSPVFCYPGGAFNNNAQHSVAEAGFRAVVTTKRTNDLGDTLPCIGRTGIHQDAAASTQRFAARLIFPGYF